MVILLSVVLIVLSACVVVYPFLKHRNPAANADLGNDAGVTDSKMESLLEDMRILHLDYQSGNIPDGLYQEQLQAYRLQAASQLQQQAERQPMGEDWELEQEILMARLSSQAQVRLDSVELTETEEPPEPAPDLREDSER